MLEVWKDVVGFEGFYQVSNLGNVKSLDRAEEYYMPKLDLWAVRNRKGRILKQKINRGGYPCVHLRNNDNKETWPTIHRLVLSAFVENTDNKPTINHKNGCKKDNKLENLEWATHSENTQHAYDSGLAKSIIKNYSKSLEENYSSKLKNSDIPEIKKKRSEGMTLEAISKLYNVGISTIHRICNGLSWKTLT